MHQQWLGGEKVGQPAGLDVDHVQVQVGDQVVPIVPRFVVLAAGVGNAAHTD